MVTNLKQDYTLKYYDVLNWLFPTIINKNI